MMHISLKWILLMQAACLMLSCSNAVVGKNNSEDDASVDNGTKSSDDTRNESAGSGNNGTSTGDADDDTGKGDTASDESEDTFVETDDTASDDADHDWNENTDDIGDGNSDTEGTGDRDTGGDETHDSYSDTGMETESAGNTEPDSETDTRADIDSDAGSDTGLSTENRTDTDEIVTEYTCNIGAEPSPFPEDNELFRKFVSISSVFVDRFDTVQVTEVLMQYGTAPSHASSGRAPHYTIHLESDSHELIEEYFTSFTGVAWPADSGCYLDVAYDGPNLRFNFIDQFTRYATVFDINETIECGDENYTGYGAKLLTVDIGPCFERFCSEAALDGDPLCN